MAKASKAKKNAQEAQNRAERLKAALKANMGRRKAQARARSVAADAEHQQNNGQNPASEESS